MSSYDVGVWYSAADLTDSGAADYFARLNSRTIVVEHRPEFDAFLRELTQRFPDRVADAPPVSTDVVSPALLETWDDLKAERPPAPLNPAQREKLVRDEAVFENSPWGESLWADGDAMVIPFRWSRAKETIPIVVAMARRHNLTVFDSQSGHVTNPDRAPTQRASDFLTVHLTLRLDGQSPAVKATLAQDGRTVLDVTVPDRATAHRTVRQFALERHERAYDVVDPRSLAQGFRIVPDAPGKGLIPPDVITALRRHGVSVETGTFEGPDGPASSVAPRSDQHQPPQR